MTNDPESHPGDDYLYDGTGTPDPRIARLERALRPLGAQDDAVPPAATAAFQPPARSYWPVAAAAVLLVGISAAFVATFSASAPVMTSRVSSVVLSSTSIAAPSADIGEWNVGRRIEASGDSRDLTLGADAGHVTLRPNSVLHVVDVSDDTMRLRLERGSMEARIAASVRPRFFQVDTEAARCVDLGCRYTLEVTDAGDSVVRVLTGQVAFETGRREVFVPAGATAIARKDHGPGTPRFEDARPSLADAFDAFDVAPLERRALSALAALEQVRDARDTLPAWHLLQETDEEVVRAAITRLTFVAGNCDVPAGTAPRDAWKAHLEPLW